MQRIAEADQQRLLGAPASIVGTPAHQRALLGLVEAGALGEEGDVHAPFVFRAAAGRDAVDDDLALAQRQVALVEQACAHEALEQALSRASARNSTSGGDARRHQRIEAGLDFGR